MRLYRHSRKQRRDRASPKHYRENTAHKAKTGKKRVVITAAVASAVAFSFGIIAYALLNNCVTSSVNAVKTANYAQNYSINGGTFTWSQSGVTMGSSAEVEFSDSQAGTYTLTISPPAKSSTQADKGYCVITVTDICDDTPETIVTPSVASGSTQTFTLNVRGAGKLKFAPHWGEPEKYSQTPNISNGGTIVVGESQQPVTANRFTHSDNLANVDTYLYRVGNGNTVTLGTLFKVDTRAAVVSDNVSVTFENTAGNADMPTYTKNSDWTKSTVKFTGEGVGGVTIKEGNGTPYTLNLEIVTANNFIENATVNGNANIVLLGNVKLGGSSGTNPALSLNGKKLFGNGFQIDATGSNISTKGHGLISLTNKDLITSSSVNYTKTVLVNVAVKKVAPNAVITVSQTNGTMIWGSAGSFLDPDYQPAAQIFDYMTITDYDNDGTAYTVLDGNNQAAFLNSIASVVADSDNKTGFTINFPDGTKLVIKCGAPYNSGTLEFKKYNNKFLMCGSKAYNNPTAATWNVTSYTYTGRNGVAVTYGKRGFTSTTDSTTCSLKSLGTNNFLMYDAQGGTVSPTYTSTSPATLPTPTREGYTFLNWNTKADGTGTKRNAGTSYSFSSSTTLYAIWAKNVTVSFSSEGAIISTISAGAGSTKNLPATTMTSSWLEGWYTEESGGTKVGNGGASFTLPNSDTTYYAHWSPKFTVAYNANGGTVGVAQAVYEGTALTLPTPTNGVKTFEGWFTAAEGGTLVGTGGDSYTPTADIELFAHWSDNILVTFNGNGGTAGTNSATYDNVNPITLPTATWAGHQFNGWYTAANGGTKVGDAGASYTPTEPVTLYARWTAYTVTYNANGGSVSPTSASAGANGTVTLPIPTQTGYTFNGWYMCTSLLKPRTIISVINL